ncbi:MucBP domain-containing protein [Lactococcus garvieae]|uniref:MucBP domain-containing protein n=1 Tax=Lactococcus garvieae TaxID=1363 RepID=UPI00398E4F1B
MKKLTSVLALGTILLGALAPTIKGIAETAQLSNATNTIGVENGQVGESSTQDINGIDTKSTRPINNADGTVDFLGKTWDVIKDYGNGNKMIAMEDKIADSQFNPEWYFNTNDDNSNGYQDSVVKSIVDGWYNTNISGTAYEQFVQPVTPSNPTLGPIKQTYGWASNDDISGSIGYTPWVSTILASDKYPTLVGSGAKQAFLMSGSDVTKDSTGKSLNDAVIKHIEKLTNNGISTSWLSTVGGYSNFASDLMSGSSEVRNHLVTNVQAVVPSLVVQTFENGAPVTVKYQDEEGNTLSDEVVKSGVIGEDYTTEQKDIPGYTLKEVQGNATGKFTDQPQNVTYVYEPTKDQSTVVVHDSELTVGDTWKPEDNFDSATDYDGNALPFSDITVDGSVDTSKVGTYKVTYSRILPAFFSAENQGEYSAVATITVKDAQPVKGGDVTAKYIDTDGNKISDDIVKTGSVGETYTTEQIAIDGYTFKEVQGKLTGQFTNQAQTVTYVYTKNEIPNVTGTVLVKYVDTDGNNISEDVVKSGTVGEGYSTEKKAIEGYTFKEVQGNTTGQFTNQVQTVTYVYAKNKANTVNTEPKPENKPDSKDKNDNQGITSSKQHGLPATGENERMTMMSIILGLVLLTVVMIISIFRFKKVNK